ncbi:dna replication licensing factor mcm2, putative, partial [Perkinsus marinus ATCC 50983]
QYDPELSFAENTTLGKPLISQFDLLCVMRDVSDRERDTKLAKFVLKNHRLRISSEDNRVMNNQQDQADFERIDQTLLWKYISYAREHVEPVLDKDDKYDKITRFSADIRASN